MRLKAMLVLWSSLAAAPAWTTMAWAATSGITFVTHELTFPVASLSFLHSLDVTETASTIEVNLPADILFDFDKAELRPNAEETLQETADLIRRSGRGKIAIKGYTDSLGTEPYNQHLSERRAAAVKAWLIKHGPPPAATLSTIGLGARDPVTPNQHTDGTDNPDGRQRNRRVMLVIEK